MMRRNFTTQTRLDAFRRAGGRCEGRLDGGARCNAVLVPGRWRCDHIIPDAMGGEPTLENAQCLCPLCDGRKTPRDVTEIARAKRREARAVGADMPKRGFRGWRRFNGDRVWRDDA